MILWTIFIPTAALVLILYFRYIDVFFNGKKKAFLIEGEEIPRSDVREIGNTVLNLIVFALCGSIMGYWIENGSTCVYREIPESLFDHVYLVIAFFASLAIHDIYFYWTHRLLHLRPIYKYIHIWHHKSHKVNAWSAFSFHPLEGILQIAVVPIVAWFLPIHEWILMLFTFFLLFISVYGHCGYELRPYKLSFFQLFNTSLHHFQHHKYVQYNFGIYLNFWDKLFKTNYPKYETEFEELKSKIQQKKATSASNHDE